MFGMSIASNALWGIEKPKGRKNGVCNSWETKENNNLQELKSQKKRKKEFCVFHRKRKGERLDNII